MIAQPLEIRMLEFVLAHATDRILGRFDVQIRHDHEIDVALVFERAQPFAFFVDQVGGNFHRYFGDDFRGAIFARFLADEAIRDGRSVVVLFGAASAREVYPSNLLPDEVEYVVATDDGSLGHRGFVTELVPAYEGWADQAFACGPAPMLRALAGLAAEAINPLAGQHRRQPDEQQEGRERQRYWPGNDGQRDQHHRRHHHGNDGRRNGMGIEVFDRLDVLGGEADQVSDRKSTRLNSSHRT